jgi:ankyrin repeat protein
MSEKETTMRENKDASEFKLSVLTPFIEKKDLEHFTKLYKENKVTICSTYDRNITLLQVSVLYNSIQITDFLLDEGHNPFMKDAFGNSAFTACYLNENEHLAVHMFKKFIQINSIEISSIPSLVESLELDQKNHEFAIEFVKHICKKSEPESVLRTKLFESNEYATICFQTIMDYLQDEENGGFGELYMYYEIDSDNE